MTVESFADEAIDMSATGHSASDGLTEGLQELAVEAVVFIERAGETAIFVQITGETVVFIQTETVVLVERTIETSITAVPRTIAGH